MPKGRRLSLDAATGRPVSGSVEIEVASGGPVAVYASIIDNRTQDPIMVPATVVWQGP